MARKKGSKNKPKMNRAAEAESPDAITEGEPTGAPFTAEKKYLAKIKIAGKEYLVEGATLDEAVLNLHPYVKKGVSILTLSYGDISITKIINGPTMHKLFNSGNDLMKRIALKNIKTIFRF